MDLSHRFPHSTSPRTRLQDGVDPRYDVLHVEWVVGGGDGGAFDARDHEVPGDARRGVKALGMRDFGGVVGRVVVLLATMPARTWPGM